MLEGDNALASLEMWTKVMSIDTTELRKALGSFVTGVTVVTTIDETGNPRGMTANSFTSVSLDPPLILVCISAHAKSAETFRNCRSFSVNVLRAGAHDIADVFASSRSDKFECVSWTRGQTGAPRIADSISVLDCRVHRRVPMGDHFLLVGEVDDFEVCVDQPLAFFRGSYLPLAADQTGRAQS